MYLKWIVFGICVFMVMSANGVDQTVTVPEPPKPQETGGANAGSPNITPTKLPITAAPPTQPPTTTPPTKPSTTTPPTKPSTTTPPTKPPTTTSPTQSPTTTSPTKPPTTKPATSGSNGEPPTPAGGGGSGSGNVLSSPEGTVPLVSGNGKSSSSIPFVLIIAGGILLIVGIILGVLVIMGKFDGKKVKKEYPKICDLE